MGAQGRLLFCLLVAALTGALLIGGGTVRADQETQGSDAPAGQEAPTTSADTSPGTDGHDADAHDADGHGGDDHGGGGHNDPFAPILFGFASLVVAALIGRAIAARLDQPTVLGDLLMGVVLGNVGYALQQPFAIVIMHLDAVSGIFRETWNNNLPVGQAIQAFFSSEQLQSGGIGDQVFDIVTGSHGSMFVMVAFSIWIFSNLGVILLLFMVGLESSVDEMLGVGPRSLLVALVGIVAPFGLGYGSSLWLLPNEPQTVHLFLGATLTATSVGITARVFKDLNKIHSTEAKVILGAAVIDDVLGLIILAVVVGIVSTGGVDLLGILKILLLSVVFLGGLMWLGDRISVTLARMVAALNRPHAKLLLPLTFACMMSFAANQIELAAIVGAFAAGLILKEEHFRDRRHTIEDMIDPLEAIFAPIFFVLMGMQVNLRTFLDPNTVALAAAFTVMAVIGKVVSGLPVGKKYDQLSVGLGMIPRGEVGLIFASIGKGLGVVTDSLFSAVVMMVIVTTLVTPMALKWSLNRERPAAAG